MSKIKTVRCPRLSEGLASRVGAEAMVIFEPAVPHKPQAIMCERFDSEKKECTARYRDTKETTEYVPCIYAQWNKFKE